MWDARDVEPNSNNLDPSTYTQLIAINIPPSHEHVSRYKIYMLLGRFSM